MNPSQGLGGGSNALDSSEIKTTLAPHWFWHGHLLPPTTFGTTPSHSDTCITLNTSCSPSHFYTLPLAPPAWAPSLPCSSITQGFRGLPLTSGWHFLLTQTPPHPACCSAPPWDKCMLLGCSAHCSYKKLLTVCQGLALRARSVAILLSNTPHCHPCLCFH